MSLIASRDNPRVRRWRELSRDARARREARAAMVEGVHLVDACLSAGRAVKALILSVSGETKPELASAVRHYGKAPVVVSDAVFRAIADTEAPAGIAAEIELPRPSMDLASSASCIFLENIQDPGNVGAILRSAAAFGLRDIVLGRGCADAWSPKALRAGMGAHFSLLIEDDADLGAAIKQFGGNVACTVPRGGIPLSKAELSGRLGWIFGTEGKGVTEGVRKKASVEITIPMKGLSESLNVAAAAAICFYELSRRGARA